MKIVPALSLGVSFASFVCCALLIACSSVPHFKPSKAPEEASSYHAALQLCAEYQAPFKRNSSGAALPTQSSVLTPWITCLETTFRKFPETRTDRNLIAFFRELRAARDVVQPSSREAIEADVFNEIVPRVLKSVALTDKDRQTLERVLPGYAIFLAEAGAFERKATTAGADLDPEVRRLKEELRADARRPGRQNIVSGVYKNYCKQWKGYATLVGDLEDLDRYRRILQNTRSEKASLEKVEDRFSQLKLEAKTQRDVLQKELQEIRSAAHGFTTGNCL